MKIHRFFLVAAMLTLIYGTANAGIISFTAGYLVGSNNGSSNGSGGKAAVISSDKYDTISCEANGERCKHPYGWGNGDLPPDTYAKIVGYETVHKRSVAIIDGKKYIVLEVSK